MRYPDQQSAAAAAIVARVQADNEYEYELKYVGFKCAPTRDRLRPSKS